MNSDATRAALLASALPSSRKKLFIVLKFGGKRRLAMTEDQLRFEIAKEVANGSVGVRFKEGSLVFEAYEIDPESDEFKNLQKE